MSVEYRVSETPEEDHACYQFRYQIYIEEMGRPCSDANNTDKTIIDRFDKTATQLYVTNGNGIVAAARVNFSEDGPVEFEDEYAIHSFLSIGAGPLTTTSKFMIAPEYRQSLVTAKFTSRLYEFGLEIGSRLDFCNANPPLDKTLYERLGYQRYKENFKHPDYGFVVAMGLGMNDYDYLKAYRSPFSRIAKKYMHNGNSCILPNHEGFKAFHDIK